MAEVAVRATDVPARIGRHEVLGFLASGGMSEIFLGREPSGQPVVIKRILPHLTRQQSFVTMFIDEARIGSMLRHPNVVEVFELGQVGTELFMVMELLDGENTASLVRRALVRSERLDYGLAAHIIAEACEGLHAAHELSDDAGQRLGLVHRDVSPQNVFVTYDGAVKVLDFGIATATHRLSHTVTGQLKGKFAYMSPEQCRGEPLDGRSDVFSLGVVLYELTVQRRLFARRNELLVLKAVCDDPIPRPSRDAPHYPPFLEDIVMRALSRDKDKRYPSAAALRDDLRAAVQMLLPGTPREVLAGEMQRLFAERIEAKASMLRQVRAGTSPGPLPSTEVDEGVEVPQASVATATPQPAPPPRRRRNAIAALLFAIACATAGIAYVSVGGGSARGAAAVTPPSPGPVPVATAPAVAPPAPAVIAPATTPEVVVHVESTPTGAEVSYDGEVRGQTPLDLHLPAGAPKALLELRYDGYRTVRKRVGGERDATLELAMRKRTPKPADGDGGDDDGFHRFD